MYGEQKTVYFIISVVCIFGLCFLIGLTIYYVRKLMIKENLIKMHAKNDQIHASNMSLRRQYQTNVNEHKPNYSLNQPIPIIIQNSNTNLSLSSQQKPQTSTKPADKSYGFYQI